MFVVRDAEAKIREIVQRIVRQFNPEKVVLFGSRARREPRPDSDADLLVVMRRVESRRRTAVQIRMAVRDIAIPKDIVVVTSEDVERYGHLVGTIIRPALQEGRVLYERGR